MDSLIWTYTRQCAQAIRRGGDEVENARWDAADVEG